MQRSDTFLLRGGLDLVTPRIAAAKGTAQAAVNYEPGPRGYQRMQGYERSDGRLKPSEATYYVATWFDGNALLPAGSTVVGGTSGATAIVLVDGIIDEFRIVAEMTFDVVDGSPVVIAPPGTYEDGDATGQVALVDITGTFVEGEALRIDGVTHCFISQLPLLSGARTDEDDAAFRLAAVERLRALIEAPDGSGPVRGVWTLGGAVYAFRDNADASAGVMHKQTPAGWVAQNLGHIVAFSTGTGEPVEGETLTCGSVTAVIRRIIITGGTWDTDAAGYMVISGASGTLAAGGATTPGGGAFNITGPQVASSLPAGGRYDFTNHNFYGPAYAEKMYAANGVGRAFEWDGAYFAPVYTGLSDALDKPTHVAEFSNHLFLGYTSGTVQHSGIGEPLDFTALAGAASLEFGSPVTGLVENAFSSLVVLGREKVGYIVGKDSEDFTLVLVSDSAGAMPWTAQLIGRPTYIDNLGIRDMSAAETLGNWRMGTVSQLVEPLMRLYRESRVSPVASMRVRGKDQYRVFYGDRSGLFCYVGQKKPEILPFALLIDVSCACSGTDANGDEILLVGAEDGFVYEMDSGTSFDGEAIEAQIRMHYSAPGGTQQEWRFHKAVLEVDAPAGTRIFVNYDFSYGDPNAPAGVDEQVALNSTGGFWDDGATNWDESYWDAAVQGRAEAYLEGIGYNVSICVISEQADVAPHTLTSERINYTPRRFLR